MRLCTPVAGYRLCVTVHPVHAHRNYCVSAREGGLTCGPQSRCVSLWAAFSKKGHQQAAWNAFGACTLYHRHTRRRSGSLYTT